MPSRAQYDLIKVLRKLQIFRELDEEEALSIVGLCQRQAFDEGHVVWRPGDPGVDMQVLISGKLHVKNADGDVVGMVLPGASFGEMACLTGHDRYVGFEAVEPSTSLSLSRTGLRSLISRQPALYVKILETTIELLAQRVTRASSGGVRETAEGEHSLW